MVKYFALVWRRRVVVGLCCLIGALSAIVVTILMPKVYEATSTLVAPKESVGTSLFGTLAASGLVQQFPAIGSSYSVTPNRDLLLGVLKSRTVAEKIVERFKLQERYRLRYKEDAIKQLHGITNISVSRESVISIKVEDVDPSIAAEIANFYIDQLDRLVSKFGIGEAGHQREFLTEQLARARVGLEAAEEDMRRYQERNRAIALQEQTRWAIEGAARLKGEIVAAEIQVQVMRSFATEANPEMMALQRRIAEMKRQLSQMQYGELDGLRTRGSERERDFSVPFPRVPGVGLELARLTRDVKIQETVVTLLTQQIEQAKLGEARDLPVVQVLDRAIPSERHSRPRFSANLAIAELLSITVGVSLVLLLEARGRARRSA